MASQSNALLQLAVFAFLKLAIELRLAGKNDLQHFPAPRFQVPKEPDFFQNSPIQILRLIDNQHRGLVLVCALNQHRIQCEQDFGLRVARARKIEIVRDHFEELLRRQS